MTAVFFRCFPYSLRHNVGLRWSTWLPGRTGHRSVLRWRTNGRLVSLTNLPRWATFIYL